MVLLGGKGMAGRVEEEEDGGGGVATLAGSLSAIHCYYPNNTEVPILYDGKKKDVLRKEKGRSLSLFHTL
jgi:hypothetical protein